MPFSKIISGNSRIQAILKKKGTAFGSKVGPDKHSIYVGDRVQVPQGATFYAPLSAGTIDHAGYAADTFTRGSDGLYRPAINADWNIAGNDVPRFESKRILMEPASTNVFLNSTAPVTQTINLGTTGEWTLSVYGSGSVTSANVGGTATGHGTAIDGTPVTINVTVAGTFSFTVSGQPDYVQVENQPVATSPIITQGASASRDIDALQWDAASSVNDAQGMLGFVFVPRFNYNSVAPGSLDRPQFVTMRDNLRSYIYWEYSAASSSAIRLRDAASNFNSVIMGTEPENGLSYQVFARWNGAVAQVGYRNGSGWTWGLEGVFGGLNAQFIRSTGEYLPFLMSELTVYNEDQGTAWIEANYP